MDFHGFHGCCQISWIPGVRGFAGRCRPLPAAARLMSRAAGPKETLDGSGLQAWRPGGLDAWRLGKARRLEGLGEGSKACWLGGLAR